jgi:hypothetical protein
MKNRTVLLCFFVLCAQANLAWGGPIPEAVAKLPPYIPAEYQDAVSKVLPGYEILRNKDFVQDETQLKKFISPDEIAARKKRAALGFIVGRFNDDQFQDFAAWVVNRSIEQEKPGMLKSEIWKGSFASRLVVCLGTNTPRAYQCEILPTLWDFISLPYWADLILIKASEVQCEDDEHADEPIAAFYPEGWKGKRPSGGVGEVPARKLRPNYDAIGQQAIGKNYGWTLIRGADGVYLSCGAGAD